MTDPTPLSIEHLDKYYGKIHAVCDVSFTIKPGEIFGLLGPNGAGKTSIISSITTLQAPSNGVIKVFGIDVTKNPRLAKSSIGFVPQELIHHGFFSVEQILRYHATYFGIRIDNDYLFYLLKRLQLYNHRNKLVNQLSGGMKRRLLIIKALLHKPKLLLLDEPTAGVDVELRASIWKFIQDLKTENIAILLTTHYLEEAERLCDRIAILDKGHIKKTDFTQRLLVEHSSKKVSFILKTTIPELSHPLLVAQTYKQLDFVVPNEMSLSTIIEEANIPFDTVLDVNVKKGTLEDVMQNILSYAHE